MVPESFIFSKSDLLSIHSFSSVIFNYVLCSYVIISIFCGLVWFVLAGFSLVIDTESALYVCYFLFNVCMMAMTEGAVLTS